MSPHRRIPNVISIFNAYLRNTDDYLQKIIDPLPPVFYNWKRLGLTQENADEWHGRRLEWELLYEKHADVNSKTKTVNQEVRRFMKEFIAFGSPLLNVMASGIAVTQTDASEFRFTIGRKKRSRPTIPILEQCFPKLAGLGKGMIKLTCLMEAGRNRPALPETANSVLLAFKVGEPAPESPDDCQKMMIITRSKFIYDVGTKHLPGRLYLFARYYNTRYHHLAGPWSERATVMLA